MAKLSQKQTDARLLKRVEKTIKTYKAGNSNLKIFWLSWYSKISKPAAQFCIHTPWWVSGYSGDGEFATVCALVLASDEKAAKDYIRSCHDDKSVELKWRFCDESNGKTGDRFQFADWMKWIN